MSYNGTGIFSAGICVEKLLDLADIKGDLNNPLFKRTPLGYLEALTSPLNQTGSVSIEKQDGAKERTVRIKWTKRDVQTQVMTAKSTTCTPDDYADFDEEFVTVDNYVARNMGFKTSEIKKICEGRTEFMQTRLKAAFDAMSREINDTILTDQALNFGINIETGDALPKSLTVFPAVTGAPNAVPLQELDHDYNVENEMLGNMFLIGAGNIYKYWRTLEASCCNDGGVDMLELSNRLGWAPFVDKTVEKILGNNQFLVMEPGSNQLITFNDYVGEDATNQDGVERTTIVDPRTGLRYDMKVFQDSCNDDWTIMLFLNYDIWFTPVDQYHWDDPLYGVRGTLRYSAITS